jgi:acyl-homoserine-lactone acylase
MWSAMDKAGRQLAPKQGHNPADWDSSATAERISFVPGLLTVPGSSTLYTMRYTNRPSGIQQVMSFTAMRRRTRAADAGSQPDPGRKFVRSSIRRVPRGFQLRRVAAAAGLTAAVIAGCAGAASAESIRAAARQPATNALNQVSITRDSAGIPHIRAKSFTLLGIGEGYAFAQDNLCTFANDVVTLNGQRSEYFGPNGQAVNYSAGTYESNLQSDLWWRYVNASGIVQRELNAPPPNGPLPQVRQLYTGFTEGYNAYLRSGKLRDPSCKGKPWVRPITLTDMLLRAEQIVTEGSSQQFISGLVSAAPPATAAQAAHAGRAVSSTLDLAALKAQFGDSADRAQGSNGIGLGAQDTRSGNGMVLANPHFPWRGTERFWMTQLTVPGSYNVEGGTLEGYPLIGIGFNQHLAWTHTVSTSRRSIAYQLKLVPGDPTSYYLDGQPVKMGQVTVGLKYGKNRVMHTFYTTQWGVVADVPAANYAWTTTNAYALYDATAADGPRSANQYLRIGQATTVQGLYGVEAQYLAIPTFNTIAADDRGNAYYGDVGDTPNVSQAEINSCLPAGGPTLVFEAARVVTLDGSRSACAAANDPGTPVKGIFDGSQLPHIFRRDYVENSNDSYWLANPSAPLTGFSPIIGLTGTQQGLRTQLGNEMIAERVAGTDGLGAPKFTISTLQRMWESDRSRLAEMVLAPLVSDCRAHPFAVASNGQTVDLTTACQALAGYNRTGSESATGGWLFSEWNQLYTKGTFWANPFNPSAPLTTPSGLNTTNPDTLQALADAVLELRGHGIALDASYGQVQHATRGRSKIPIHGCDTGCFNAIYASDGRSTSPVDQASYGEVYDGSSLVMTTQLNPSGPTSQGTLTYSQATDPTSPWYANMTRLYSRRGWVKLAYTQAQLNAEHPPLTLILSVR